MTVKELSQNLYLCYSKELCYPKVRKYWTESNKYFGMCAITALIVNDYFGGNICKIYVDGISHYYNLIDNIITEDTENRYRLLKRKLEEIKI